MIRLSLHMREPLHIMLRWPDWVVGIYRAFLAKEPTVEERIEYAMAEQQSHYYATHSTSTAPHKTAADFLFFRKAWNDDQKELDEIILEEARQEQTL